MSMKSNVDRDIKMEQFFMVIPVQEMGWALTNAI